MSYSVSFFLTRYFWTPYSIEEIEKRDIKTDIRSRRIKRRTHRNSKVSYSRVSSQSTFSN